MRRLVRAFSHPEEIPASGKSSKAGKERESDSKSDDSLSSGSDEYSHTSSAESDEHSNESFHRDRPYLADSSADLHLEDENTRPGSPPQD